MQINFEKSLSSMFACVMFLKLVYYCNDIDEPGAGKEEKVPLHTLQGYKM